MTSGFPVEQQSVAGLQGLQRLKTCEQKTNSQLIATGSPVKDESLSWFPSAVANSLPSKLTLQLGGTEESTSDVFSEYAHLS